MEIALAVTPVLAGSLVIAAGGVVVLTRALIQLAVPRDERRRR